MGRISWTSRSRGLSFASGEAQVEAALLAPAAEAAPRSTLSYCPDGRLVDAGRAGQRLGKTSPVWARTYVAAGAGVCLEAALSQVSGGSGCVTALLPGRARWR